VWNNLFGKWHTVYFTSPKIPFDNIFEGGIEEDLIRLIDNTKKTLDVAVFEFDLENVAQSLIRAHRRGVRVRLVYDNQFSDYLTIKSLVDAGIATVPDNRSAYMHNKFFIFDRKYVWTGSFNISLNSAYRNNENAVVIFDRLLARNYSLEFEEMFVGKFGKTSPDNTDDIFSIRGVRVENYFAPEAEVIGHIINLVRTAKRHIHFLAFSFTDDSLADALIEMMSAGISVSGVFESRGSHRSSSKYSKLLQAGAAVMRDANPRTMHHKVFIIDGRLVIFGSYNFSSNAAQVNDENLLVIFDPFLAGKYETEFQKIFARASKPKAARKPKRS